MELIRLLRPHQWLKNFFIFIPLFFDSHLFDIEYALPAFLMFISYSFAASGIYCFNDIWDVEADKKHPEKCKRPIACGAISKMQGYTLMILCFIISFVIVWFLCLLYGKSNIVIFIVVFYIIINIFYCVYLKRIAIIDVFIIAIGFVLRIFAGGFVTDIYLSHWLIMMTFLLALFLAFAKRRDDVVMYEESGVVLRRNINRYNLTFMNQIINIIASIIIVCYIMYTVSEEVVMRFDSPYVYVTSLFVLAGVIRYLQISVVDLKSGSPTKVLLTDRFIQAMLVGWILTFYFIIYVI